MALFDKETCDWTSPFTFTSSWANWWTWTATKDTTSKITWANSIVYANTWEASISSIKTLASTYTTLYFQFKLFLPTWFNFWTDNYCSILSAWNTWQTTELFWASLELNWSDIQLTIQGNSLAYANTGINIPINSISTIEIKVVKSTTVGNVSIWLNNSVVWSPNYNSWNVNTWATAMKVIEFGKTYVPVTQSNFYMDDFIINSSFIWWWAVVNKWIWHFII
jgi:hypothetical protein